MADYRGRQLGNYRLIRLLGEGAFAQVYLGEHIYLSTQAAIKILTTQASDMNWFFTEARNIARLVHPNIVRVLEFGVESDTPFLVMDYASGGTLRQRHPAGIPVPLPTVVSYVKQIADALQYAHDEKLIHRDVKPENTLLGRRDEVLLSDFGIALMVQTMQLQRVQDVAGTLLYMAPEQIQGQPRPASDQYSLGIMAYEWLTGNRPFGGSSLTEIISQHLAVPPPLLRARMPTVSPAVEQVVLTALAKNPEQRFATVRAFALALEQASQSPLPKETDGVVPALDQTVLAPSSVATVLPPPVSVRRTETPRTFVSAYRGHMNAVCSLAWSPNSSRIFSVSNDKTVHVWEASTGKNLQIYQDISDAVRAVALSADGSRVATVGSDNQIRVWDFATNRLVLTYLGHTSTTVKVLAWSPTQQILASSASDGSIHVWDTTTGQTLTIYRGHAGSVNSLAWSPNEPASESGSFLVSGADDATVQIWEAFTGKNISQYQGQTAKVSTVAWSPRTYSVSSSESASISQTNSSSRVACGREDGLIQMWDTTTNREVLSYRYSAPISVVAWSPDGRRFAYAGTNTSVDVWDAMTNRKLVTFSHPSPPLVMAWSPDGKYIASGGSDTTIQVWLAP